MPPDVLGAISVVLPVPDGADQVSAQLVGRLHRPDGAFPEALEARTETTALLPA